MCGTNKYGFPIRHRSRKKMHFGFTTGDMVEAKVPADESKYAGTNRGRVTVRARPYVRLNGHDVNVRYCRLLQRADGYEYGC